MQKKNIDYFLHHHVHPFKIPAGYKYNMELFGFKMDYRIGQLLPTTMDKWVATWDDFHQMLLYDDFAHYQSINRLTDTHLYDINDYPSLVLLI